MVGEVSPAVDARVGAMALREVGLERLHHCCGRDGRPYVLVTPWLTFVRCPDVKRRYPGGARRWHSVGRALSTRGGSGTARAAATVAVGHPGARGPRTATAMR